MQTNFLLGSIEMTVDAHKTLKRLPYDLIARHAINDHGLITDQERQQNALSMRIIGPIVSRYIADPTDPTSPHVRIETDRLWGSTVVSLE